MKYLVVARGFSEPDNNTPSDDIWVKITDIEPSEMAKCEKIYTDEFAEDYQHGVSIDFYPLAELDEDWTKVVEIW